MGVPQGDQSDCSIETSYDLMNSSRTVHVNCPETVQHGTVPGKSGPPPKIVKLHTQN